MLEFNTEDCQLSSSDCSEMSDYEEAYEKQLRNRKRELTVRELLPAKGKAGLIFRSEIIHDDNHVAPAQDLEAEDGNDEGNKERCVDGNFIQMYANQQKRLKELKIKVGLLGSRIVEDPENHMKALKELIVMLQNNNTGMVISEKKLLAFSLLQIFTDILPGYRIRVAGDASKQIKLKKDTRKLLDYEMTLLRNYKRYLDCLQVMVNNMKAKRAQRQKSVGQKALQEVAIVAVKCLCELLISRMNFNYFKNIVNIVVPLAVRRQVDISDICCQAIGKLYRSDRLGEASLEILKLTCKVLKEKKFSVPENLMRTFLQLNVEEASAKDGNNNKKDMKKLRKQLKMMSRKERKHSKKMRGLEMQLREAEAQENLESKSKFHMEILQKMFWAYFHIIKDSQKFSLLAPVLEGLSKFAHLINFEYFDDLSNILGGIMEKKGLSDSDRFHCMQTMFTILLGHAESLNVDPQKMYSHLYKVTLNLQLNSLVQNYVLASNCVELMLIKRRKNISANRTLAFIKRLCTVALQAPLPGILVCLSLVRKMMMASPCSTILLDTQETVGSGMFSPELEDPEHCHANSSVLWELHLLQHHSDTTVGVFASHILHGCPAQGRFCLTSELSKMSSEDLVNHFGKDNLYDEKSSKGKSACGNPAKRRKLSGVDISLCCDESVVTWDDVKKANFKKNVS